MLGLFSSSRAVTARRRRVAELTAGAAAALQAMHPAERAAVLMLANAQMAMVARARGEAFLSAPSRVAAAVGAAVVDELLEIHAAQSAAAARAPAAMGRYFRAHLQATLVCLATAAVADEGAARRPACARLWRTLHEQRDRAEQALVWLRRGEAAAGVPCFPPPSPGRAVTDIDALAMAASVPAFLRRKRPAVPVAAAGGEKPA